MSELAIFDTEGTRVYPDHGSADPAIAEAVDDLATLPPWPVTWFDGETGRLYQRMTAVRQREDYSTRPNTYYVVLARGSLDRLDAAAGELAERFDGRWERPDGHDEPATDPLEVLDVWREDPEPIRLGPGAEASLGESERLCWRAPDLPTAYALLAAIRDIDETTTVAITTDSEAVADAAVVIALGDVRDIEPFPETSERIDAAAQTSRETQAAAARSGVRNGLAIVTDRATRSPGDALAAIVLTGSMHRAIRAGDGTDRVLSGDPKAIVPEGATLEAQGASLAGLHAEDLADIHAGFREAIARGHEDPSVDPVGLERAEAHLRREVLEAHLEAIEAYTQVEIDADANDRYAYLEDLEVVRREWLDGIEDPGVQLGALPILGRFLGGVPMPSPSDARAALEERIEGNRERILRNAFEDLDEQIEEFVGEWAEYTGRDGATIRPAYLAASTAFTASDLLRGLVRPYRRWLLGMLAGLVLLTLVVARVVFLG